MRKVFLSILSETEANALDYVSDDFDLSIAKYRFPLIYLMEQVAEAGDEICVATMVEQGLLADNTYKLYQQEVKAAMDKKELKLIFVRLEARKQLGATAFHRFFKAVSKVIHNNDRLYMDITIGSKPYSMAMLIAAAYGVKACTNTDLENVIYVEKESAAESNSLITAKIYDMTGLFYINEMVGDVRQGDKRAMDTLLNMIIRD